MRKTQVENRWRNMRIDDLLRAVLRYVAHDQNMRLRKEPAQLQSLVQGRDGEHVGPQGEQGFCHHWSTMSVGICFEHSGNLDRITHDSL